MALQKLARTKEFPDQLTINTMNPTGFGQQYLVGQQKLTFQSRTYLLLALTSLQPVDEAVGMLSRSLWLMFVIALVASVLLSTVISRLIARPLIREIEREQELDKLRREFIANASHELKTPISIISGYSESLLDNIVTGNERTEYERVIHDESQKMSKLVRGMLDVSLLQKKETKFHRTEVPIDTVVLRTLRHLGLMMKQKGIRTQTEGIYPVSLTADETLMEAMLANVISNAISHTPQEGWIRIGFATIGNWLQIEIENQGDPIPVELIDRIWDPLFRVDTSHNRLEGRYGLGLSIVKGIVVGHGGECSVHNTEHGVRFVIRLPRTAR